MSTKTLGLGVLLAAALGGCQSKPRGRKLQPSPQAVVFVDAAVVAATVVPPPPGGWKATMIVVVQDGAGLPVKGSAVRVLGGVASPDACAVGRQG